MDNIFLDEAKDWVTYNLWYRPKDKIRAIRHWFKSNFNKYHFRLLKQAFMSYPWDFGFLLKLEECQIDKQIHWFENNQYIIDEQHKLVLRTLRWAKHCLHIMNTDATELYDYNYDDEKKEMEYQYFGPRVNTRNIDRFCANDNVIRKLVLGKGCFSELYFLKARALYYKIREQYTELWWD